MRARHLLLLCALALLDRRADAAPLAADEGWRYEAHLITVGPGPSSVERLGRSLLTVGRVRPGRAENLVYDLGLLESEGVLLDYLSGRVTARVLRVGTVTRALRPYVAAGRRVETQRLRLADEELERLRARLAAELQPRRQTYSIHPLGETSATRARDLVDAATSGALERALSAGHAGPARELLRQQIAGSLVSELVLDLFGGRALDRPLDTYRSLFLPHRLRDAVGEVKRSGAPLADAANVVNRGQPLAGAPLHPARKLGWGWCGLLLLVGLWACARAPRSRPAVLFLMLGPVAIGALGLLQLVALLWASAPELRTNELPLAFLCTDLTLLAAAWGWRRSRLAAGRLLLGYSVARAAVALLVLAGHAAGLLHQQPRALLAPPVAASLLLLVLVVRIRSTAAVAKSIS
jgi:hypothetical protein